MIDHFAIAYQKEIVIGGYGGAHLREEEPHPFVAMAFPRGMIFGRRAAGGPMAARDQ
jgi:hypothetical protein